MASTNKVLITYLLSMALAALPMQDPDAACRELQRCIPMN
jgi:hypothetical protein